MAPVIITIDGPAGSGKSTVSRALAKRLGYCYVDTGALYRGVAYEIQRSGIDWHDPSGLSNFLQTLLLEPLLKDDAMNLLSSGIDISNKIRTPDISMLASEVSALPEVRNFLLETQRQIAETNNSVFEGRDMGTVVFPDAQTKFFLFADLRTRALRRHREMSGSDSDAGLSSVVRDIEKRDKNDSERSQSPLKPSRDAIMIDSSNLSIEDVVELMIKTIRRDDKNA